MNGRRRVDTFYLGTDNPSWLHRRGLMEGVPLFPSHRTLRRRRTPYPAAVTRYAVDSGAFTEISQHGMWTTSPVEYVHALRRYHGELGPFDWAAQQDTMCEPFILDRVAALTGHRPTVADHQRATVENYLTLRDLAPDLPITPTLQGWQRDDYIRCLDRFAAAGVDLTHLPLVGLGSVCRRQATGEIHAIVTTLHDAGLRLHGFGVKIDGLRRAAHMLSSADSQAWSYGGRRRRQPRCRHRAQSCAHCPEWALQWRAAALTAIQAPKQEALTV